MCKKSTVSLVLFLLSFSIASAQPDQWAWMSGDVTPNQHGVYGTKGVPAASNKPGARYFATSWTDPANNLWLFGGMAFTSTTAGNTNDLWRYTPSTGLWTWMSGDDAAYYLNPPVVYGTKGVPAAGNQPGARGAAASWTDANGNLWLFGGTASVYAPDYVNDLWRYQPSTGLWAWMGGDSTRAQSGVYGTKGVASANNKPGARSYPVTWTDGTGDLWLYGGQGFAAGNAFGYLNDLWKYSVSTGQWTWVGGENFPNQPVVYGTKGMAASGNTPGARERAVGWKDNAGNLWLFGEFGYYAAGSTGLMNDLWKYTPSTGLWTWMGGDNTINQPNVYGTKGVAAPANKPGARYQSFNWTDATGKFWLFGGNNSKSTNTGLMNDLWRYDPANGLWTWISGDNIIAQPAVYGTKGVPAPENKPSARWWGVTWTDLTGNLWMYGGNGYSASGLNFLNDLWRYNVPSTLPIAAPDAVPFSIAGNPVQDNLQLSVQLPAAQTLILQISDMNGHMLISESRMAAQGSARFSIPVSRLSKGTYTIRMMAGNDSYTKTFIKQ